MEDTISSHRDSYFDNAKLILITLVVVGHIVEPILDRYGAIRSGYVFIYSFHMQMFVLISGYFSKNDGSLDSLKKNISTILLPYLLAQALFLILKSIIEGRLDIGLLDPHYALWYLLSLFFWRTILPYFVKIPYYIPLSIALALLCGYFQGIDRFLSLSRTIVFFPYFLAGYYLRNSIRLKINNLVPKKIAVLVLFITFCLSMTYPVHFEWLYHSRSYNIFGYLEWFAFSFRLMSLSAGFIIGFSVLSLVPSRNLWVTKIGSRTLYIYILHIFILKSLVVVGFYSFITTKLSLIILFSMVLVLISITSLDITRVIAMPLVEPVKFIRSINAQKIAILKTPNIN